MVLGHPIGGVEIDAGRIGEMPEIRQQVGENLLR